MINIKFVINGIDPIFIQVANFIEDCILKDLLKEGEKVPSTTEFSTTYKINPATVLKGVNLLEQNDVLYKKRGIGVFVKENAKTVITNQRKDKFKSNYVDNLVNEARSLGLNETEVIDMIKKVFSDGN